METSTREYTELALVCILSVWSDSLFAFLELFVRWYIKGDQMRDI